MYKNTRIFPSATPNSLDYLGFEDIPRLYCYTISDFTSFQAHLSEQRQRLLYERKDDDSNQSDSISENLENLENLLNIKILDGSGQVLKLAAKPVRLFL